MNCEHCTKAKNLGGQMCRPCFRKLHNLRPIFTRKKKGKRNASSVPA